MRNIVFRHLLNHYRAEKRSLVSDVKIYVDNQHTCADSSYLSIAKSSGALNCLYWQAMGNGLVNLAKGIRRTLTKAKAVHGIEGL
ncbi:hypothetical protein [Shewanella sp. YLB-07]|uniref:hypothetical protein n=1 Tax=Shewanella sp. YLB-07 TaxID=2601268 RepID=UPI00128AE2F3|nr:hypothetical protein [Shewanella sp. YLB-07]MPY25160.1 hypothetical protein [Shewanella sp. YLB-07]